MLALHLDSSERRPMANEPLYQTLSVNLAADLVKRVQSLGFHEDLSVSSIVEQALIVFLDGHTEDELAERLRNLGATLRRA